VYVDAGVLMKAKAPRLSVVVAFETGLAPSMYIIVTVAPATGAFVAASIE
jgi:hypothetical protein